MIEAIILLVCCWGCAALFLGIGIWAWHRKKPVHFWAGTKLDAKAVPDIRAYNRENGKMWIFYSVPYWIAGAFSLFAGRFRWCAIMVLILLLVACLPGLVLLIRRYKQIERTYISR